MSTAVCAVNPSHGDCASTQSDFGMEIDDPADVLDDAPSAPPPAGAARAPRRKRPRRLRDAAARLEAASSTAQGLVFELVNAKLDVLLDAEQLETSPSHCATGPHEPVRDARATPSRVTGFSRERHHVS